MQFIRNFNYKHSIPSKSIHLRGEKMTTSNISNLVQIVQQSMPNHAYHNAEHALDVYAVGNHYARALGVHGDDAKVLNAALLLHDLVYVPKAKDNEEQTAAKVPPILGPLGYSTNQISRVQDLILATKVPTSPGNDLLKQIICDADVDNLGREDFWEKNVAVAAELGIPVGPAWYKGTRDFLKSHSYYTPCAIAERNESKQKYIAELEQRF
jgi:predicted metal-dependent HD superfamily phosphohydrolase